MSYRKYLAILLVLGGCSDRATSPPSTDSIVTHDWSVADTGQGQPEAATDSLPPTESPIIGDASGTAHDYVVSRILMPATTADSQKYAFVFQGKKYNALGDMLATIMASFPKMNLQMAVDHMVCAGKSVNLLRFRSNSLLNGPVSGQSWVGSDKSCCLAKDCLDPTNKTKCNSTSIYNCYNGTATFLPSSSASPGSLTGSISGGSLSCKAPGMGFKFAVTTLATLVVNIGNAVLSGDIASGAITKGILSGVISQAEIKSTLLPTLTKLLDHFYKDPATSPTDKSMLKTLFDQNQDGTISQTEVADNPIIKALLSGDVDVDGDGTKELSMGVGFTAVGAKIQN